MGSYPYGDLGNTGRCPGPALRADPVVRWRFEAASMVSSAPVVANGSAFVTADDGTLYALDAHTGDVSWAWRTDDPGWSAAWVGVAGDVVLQGVQENEVVHALGRTDGVHRWTLDDVWYPVVVDDLLVVVGDAVRAVDLATRAERWSVRMPFGPLGARPAIGDGLVVVTGGFEGNHSHGGAVAIDLVTGAVRWTRADERRAHGVQENLYVTVHPAHAALSDGLVWLNRDISSDRPACELVALDLATGADRRVHTPVDDDFLEGSVVIGTDVLYCHSDSRLFGVDAVTGEVRSAVEFDATITATPLLAGGLLHVATDDGRLHGVDGGTVVWSAPVGDGEVDWPEHGGDEYSQRETPFMLVDGVAYVRDRNSVSALA